MLKRDCVVEIRRDTNRDNWKTKSYSIRGSLTAGAVVGLSPILRGSNLGLTAGGVIGNWASEGIRFRKVFHLEILSVYRYTQEPISRQPPTQLSPLLVPKDRLYHGYL